MSTTIHGSASFCIVPRYSKTEEISHEGKIGEDTEKIVFRSELSRFFSLEISS